ncbi:inorganic phosphate transporter [Spelaeicoccus albus]|uniref:Phosphate transporter n=1 Tax=Spelaeicoccus albus TaxID=1280376 RepID=A0A7Z0A992_9MICO|nr:inorganic phosphate transporter [Spelaeicoccus albus]NYI66677.1 PiT family inorganic phosphate transporter [Spelaeicoccus albus]
MDHITIIVSLVIALALFFDFTNGFHDTANAMATPIATGAMKPKVAVGVAAALNLVGAFLSTEVAKTVSGGIIHEGNGGISITPEMIFAGLIGAVIWNMITWLLGLPSSSSHALFGGLIGAAIVGAGFSSVNYLVVVDKVILPALLAPLIAGLVAFISTKLAYSITRRSGSPNGRSTFKLGQIFSSSLVALSHGTNDAQKTMGVITLVLISGGFQAEGSGPHIWVIAACACAIALGTYTGGWRIIKTLGTGLTEVKPAQGFAAEVSTASAVLASSHLGFALSTTQVASGSVIGSGLGRRGSKVRWKTAGRIGSGWLLTLPAAAIVGALAAAIAHLGVLGVVTDAVLGAIVVGGIFLRSHVRKQRLENPSVSQVAAAGEAVKMRKKKKKKKKQGRKNRLASKPKKKKKKGKKKTPKSGKNKSGKNKSGKKGAKAKK